MIGHESRRPAAKPRLGSGVPRASASAGVKSACPWPATTRAATVPPVRNPWLGLGQALTPNQISDAAATANAGAWLGPRTHPGGLGVLNAHNGPCPKPAACPNPRRTTGPARPHRLRSVRSATRRPGAAGRYGAAQGRTRAVSACPTRATCPALSRQRALLCAAAQDQPHLTACGCGSERDASAERCRAVVLGGAGSPRVVEALSQRRARAAQAAHVLSLIHI